MKEALSWDKKGFILELQRIAALDVTYLDIPVLQAIVKFKWDAYTRSYLMRHF